MGISKNNPGQRQEQKKRFYRGQEVRASLYVGRAVGPGLEINKKLCKFCF